MDLQIVAQLTTLSYFIATINIYFCRCDIRDLGAGVGLCATQPRMVRERVDQYPLARHL